MTVVSRSDRTLALACVRLSSRPCGQNFGWNQPEVLHIWLYSFAAISWHVLMTFDLTVLCFCRVEGPATVQTETPHSCTALD